LDLQDWHKSTSTFRLQDEHSLYIILVVYISIKNATKVIVFATFSSSEEMYAIIWEIIFGGRRAYGSGSK
jgi:hypothetical protein